MEKNSNNHQPSPQSSSATRNHVDRVVDVIEGEHYTTDDELKELAEDIVRYCPSLTHLLLALASGGGGKDPIHGMN